MADPVIDWPLRAGVAAVQVKPGRNRIRGPATVVRSSCLRSDKYAEYRRTIPKMTAISDGREQGGHDMLPKALRCWLRFPATCRRARWNSPRARRPQPRRRCRDHRYQGRPDGVVDIDSQGEVSSGTITTPPPSPVNRAEEAGRERSGRHHAAELEHVHSDPDVRRTRGI